MKTKTDEFFYEGGGRSKARSQILHCARFSPGLILLTGDQGAGASFLLQNIQSALSSEEGDFCLISDDVPIMEGEEDLYRAIAKGFGIDDIELSDIELLVEHVQRFINVGLIEKRVMVIAIDDIQHHSLEVIDALIQFVGGNKGLNLVLAGTHQLLETLKQFHIDNLVVHQVALRPLLVGELAEFISKSLTASGDLVDFTPSAKTVNEVMARTGGNMALLAQEVQQLGFETASGGKEGSLGLPLVHIAAMVLVLTTLLLVFIYYPDNSPMDEESGFEVETVLVEEVGSEAFDAPETEEPLGGQVPEIDETEQALKFSTEELPIDEPSIEDSQQVSEFLESSMADEEQDSATIELQKEIKLPAELESSRAVIDEGEPTVHDLSVSDLSVGDVGAGAGKKKSADEAASDVSLEVKEAPKQLPAVKRPLPVNKPRVASTTQTQQPQFTQQLKSLPDSFYTLQLIGVSTEKAAKEFMQSHPLQSDVYGYYEKSLNGKPWFIILFGSFASKQDALSARQDLPQILQNNKPWPRLIKDIAQEIQ